eukprot:m.39274 g.39274  ORF g.39274 m.39274 type:complete len:206 (-) comp12656_c2_seq1:476-1093(-)
MSRTEDVQSMPPKANDLYDKEFNILIIGDASVGKTSLLCRYVSNEFSDSYQSTLTNDYLTKCIEIDGQRIGVTCWDTAGQERFRTITASYYRNANAVMLAYAANEPDSFENIEGWHGEIQRYCSPAVVVSLVATKTDLAIQVKPSDAKAYAKEHSTLIAETSAKEGRGVEEAFQAIVDRLMQFKTVRRQTITARQGKPEANTCPC